MNLGGLIIKDLSIVLFVGCFILVLLLAFQQGHRRARSLSEPICLSDTLKQDGCVSERLELVVPPLSPIHDPSKGTQQQVLDSQEPKETIRLSEAGGHTQGFFTVPADACATTNESGQVIAQRWVLDGVQRDVEQIFNADGEVIETRRYLNGKLVEDVVF